MDEGLLFLLNQLLARNKIKVDKEELKFQLLGHPSYPSLYSLTGVLDHFSIPNLAVEIPKTKENIGLLPEYFIAHLANGGSDHFVLAAKEGQHFRLSYDGKKTELMLSDSFVEAWDGIVLVIERDESVKADKPVNITKLIAVVSPVVLLAWFYFFNPGFYNILHFLLSIAGIFICGLIIQHELGASSKVLDKICSGNKISCDDVMESKGAKLFGFLKLGDMGIVYFFTAILSSLFIVANGNDFTSLFQLSILALPFTLYSIFYQWLAVKKWCPLCLAVVFTLWGQSAISILGIEKALIYSFNTNTFLFLALSLYLVAAVWMFVAPKIRLKPELFKLKINHNKFKRNTEIFDSLMARTEPIDTKIPGIDEIVFGSFNSGLEVVLITNPLCGFCGKAHQLVHDAIQKEIKLRIIVRFNVSQDAERVDNKIASKLLEIYYTKGEHECLKAMDDVYTNKLHLQWLENQGEAKSNNYSNVLAKETNWCKENNIPFTPQLLINGRAYPREYDFEDILFFLNEKAELVEQAEPEQINTNEVVEL